MSSLLTVRDLTVSFAGQPAVSGVSWTVHAGRTLGVVGESGSGKSITSLAAIGLLPPTAIVERGDIKLASREQGAAPIEVLSLDPRSIQQLRGGEIAMIFQEPMTALNPVLSIGDQIIEAILLHRKLSRAEAFDEAEAALARVGITDPAARLRAFPHEFSGGMRQRVMISMALACRPRVLLADEPTTALDVTIQAKVLDLIGELCDQERLGIVLVSHDLGLIAQRADDVCVMYRGRVVEYGATREVVEQPAHPYTAALLACAPRIGTTIERLATVEQAAGSIAPLDSGATPWWPSRDCPPGTDRTSPVRLARISPKRWVAVWNDEAGAALPKEAPDLGSVDQQGAGACAS
ncbi:MAG: ABC transporter ATP-binding protein [Planctomycetota bacterium]